MAIEFKLPDLGENIESGDVVNVLVNEGDVIQADQNVLELETEKAVVDLPCPHAGKVVTIHVKPGDRIPVGSPILTLEEERQEAEPAEPEGGAEAKKEPEEEREGEAAEREPSRPTGPEAKAPRERERPEERPKEREPSAPVEAAEREPRAEREVTRARAAPEAPPREDRRPPAPAGPSTRRLARELGVDLYQVSGSGPGGRITRDDVQGFVRQRLAGGGAVGPAAPPLPDFSQWGPVERRPLTAIRRKTAENVALAWGAIPHVTQFDQADITELEAARKRLVAARGGQSGKVTVTVLALKAAVAALRDFPQFNASLDAANEEIILKRYYHIGVAVDTRQGLLVPVIRDADQKTVLELAVELETLAERARNRTVDMDSLRGGTFTITNLGGIGGTAFTPIVYHPQVAILGLARAGQQPVLDGGQITARLMLPLSLSYDHRVIDGADGARFLRRVSELLSDPLQLLIEI